MPAKVQNIRYVLHEHGQRSESFHEVQVAEVEIRSWIDPESRGVSRDLPKLGPAYPSEGLAGRSANENVDRELSGLGEVEALSQLIRLRCRNVNGLGMSRTVAEEIPSVRPGSDWVILDRSGDRKPSLLEAEGKTTAPCE